MKVRALNTVNSDDLESTNPNISPGNTYHVIGFDDEYFRLVNDAYEPVLYAKRLFEIVEPKYPGYWKRVDYGDGEYYVDPPEFSEPGFYEQLFDGNHQAVKVYQRYLKLNGIKK